MATTIKKFRGSIAGTATETYGYILTLPNILSALSNSSGKSVSAKQLIAISAIGNEGTRNLIFSFSGNATSENTTSSLDASLNFVSAPDANSTTGSTVFCLQDCVTGTGYENGISTGTLGTLLYAATDIATWGAFAVNILYWEEN